MMRHFFAKLANRNIIRIFAHGYSVKQSSQGSRNCLSEPQCEGCEVSFSNFYYYIKYVSGLFYVYKKFI